MAHLLYMLKDQSLDSYNHVHIGYNLVCTVTPAWEDGDKEDHGGLLTSQPNQNQKALGWEELYQEYTA